jgi:serpin B
MARPVLNLVMDELQNVWPDCLEREAARIDGPFQLWCFAARKLTRQASAFGASALLFFCCHHAMAQEVMKAQPAMFLSSNDHFGFELLRSTLDESRGRNVVVSPLPISLGFAALWDGAVDAESAREIQTTFYWDHVLTVPAAAKIVLQRFQQPPPRPKSHLPVPVSVREMKRQGLSPGEPETIWLSAAFLYQGAGSLSRDFIDRVEHEIGLPFRAVAGQAMPKDWDPTAPMPKPRSPGSFWITSSSHLRTSWAGNTFAMSKREKHEFHVRAGEVISADFLKSELEVYPYVRTDEFEAVELPGKEATILLVLPSSSTSIEEIISALAKKPDLIEPLLSRSIGDVELPPFHFAFEADLRPAIERMGVRRVFADPGSLSSMSPAMGGVLDGIAQKTEITVDEAGIRADSGTTISGILGGILSPPPEPFHMSLDRPFLFFVRDNLTKALFLEGAVTNPSASNNPPR